MDPSIYEAVDFADARSANGQSDLNGRCTDLFHEIRCAWWCFSLAK